MKLGTVYVEVAGPQLDGLKDFYVERLRLPVASEEPGESVWFDAGPVRIGFHAAEETSATPGVVNLSFEVDDTAAECERLLAAGVTIAQGPFVAPWNGAQVAVLFDPAGHTVWLSGPVPSGAEASEQ